MKTRLIILPILALAITTSAFAGTASSNNSDNIRTSVEGNCRVEAFSLDFGAYDGVLANATAPLDGTTSVKVYCTKGTVGTVALGVGQNLFEGSRQMRSAAGYFLKYGMFSDSARTSDWTNDSAQTATAVSKNVPLSGENGFTAYGRVFANQDVPAGSYVDTLQATVNF
jgi:spore coat protein U-like protein